MQLVSVPMPEDGHMEGMNEFSANIFSKGQISGMEFGPVYMTEEERGIFFNEVFRNLEKRFSPTPMSDGIKREGRKRWKNKNKYGGIVKRRVVFKFRKGRVCIKFRFSVGV